MSMFYTYVRLGFGHIIDLEGYDHILFVIALCAAYELKHWKQVLILITAFTLGHSLTLALAALHIVTANSHWVELGIAITILFTAIQNILFPKPGKIAIRIKYLAALVFGLIHGLGFSSYFSMLLGREANILVPLFSFNVGIELGQLIIVSAMLVFFALATRVFKLRPRDYNVFLSGAATGIALLMIMERV